MSSWRLCESAPRRRNNFFRRLDNHSPRRHFSPMAKAFGATRLPKKDYEARVPALRGALVQMQVALQKASFPVLLVVAGDEASGKGEVVNLLNGWLDPRGAETFAFHEPTDEERERPPMWRYWRCLPPRGRIAIYAGGWHADALRADPRSPREVADFAETLSRLAHFEGLLADGGALLVKVWLRLSKDAQRERLASVLYTTLEGLRVLAVALAPVMPKSTAKLWAALTEGSLGELAEQPLSDSATWGQLAAGVKIGDLDSLFPRIETDDEGK